MPGINGNKLCLDIFKDVFLASDFSSLLKGQCRVDPFSLGLVLLMVFSILLGQLANMIVVATLATHETCMATQTMEMF